MGAIITAIKFQSTHPGWGATWICAPAGHISKDFNPRTPGGVRPHIGFDYDVNIVISIHAPRVGCDNPDKTDERYNSKISIHAPRVGCDRRC